MEYLENELSYEVYTELRTSVGWWNLIEEQVRKGLANSLYTITVMDNDRPIGMGRVVGDGLYYTIVDVVVRPEFQGQGIGSTIIDKIVEYVDGETPVGGRASIQLLSAIGKEGFYIKKGFKMLPHEFCGSALRKVIRKNF